VQTATIDAAPGDFRALALQIRAAHLLDRRPGYYSLKIILTVAGFGAGWAGLLIVGNSWTTLGLAVLLGVMFTQLGFLGHDAGHQQVFRSRRANRLLGLIVGNALIGLSFGWWVPKHNSHHAHPNEVGRDPDVDAGLIPSSMRARPVGEPSGLAKFVERRQAWLYFPLMLLRSTGLYVYGIQRLLRERDRSAALEGLLIAAFAALYLTAVLSVLSPLKALAFVAVQQGVFSLYVGCSFAPNHKGMPLIEADTPMSFVRRQVITARNVAGGRFTTFMLGGLNYQIEHHLFPSMPRPNLARAQVIVREFCIESDLSYCEVSLMGSFEQIIRALRAVATASTLPRPRGATST
jgi:fatty acid desaturase